MAGLGLSLYPAQEEALFEILAGKHVVLATPTGSGKSLVATAFLFKALCEGKTGFYSCPVKALVNEKFFDLCACFGPEQVGLVTGDASVNSDAPILVGTAEILSNMALRRSRVPADFVVMDEFHYYGDRERGIAWQIPLCILKRHDLPAHVGHARRHLGHRKEAADFTGREVAAVRGASDRCRSISSTARPRCTKPSPSSSAPIARPSTWSTSPSAPPPRRCRT